MTKHKIWIKVIPQIQKDLLHSLFNCKATVEINVMRCTFFIMDVVTFNLDETHTNNPMYRIDILTDNNTKSVFIEKSNLLEFTVHF